MINWEEHTRAGYVYIISNIGSFGENIYKIGVTRRLDPTERVDELGDASVPFSFDIHATIFSDDAPALENAIHKAFEHRRMNMINYRREFFNVTLDEIENVVKTNFEKPVEFIRLPDASEYRQSIKTTRNIGKLVILDQAFRLGGMNFSTFPIIRPTNELVESTEKKFLVRRKFYNESKKSRSKDTMGKIWGYILLSWL